MVYALYAPQYRGVNGKEVKVVEGQTVLHADVLPGPSLTNDLSPV